MATGASVTSYAITHRSKQKIYQIPIPFSKSIPYWLRITSTNQLHGKSRKNNSFRVCLVMEKKAEDVIQVGKENAVKSAESIQNQVAASRLSERLARKRFERYTYLVAAIMSSLGVTSMAAMSVYYRFSLQIEVQFSTSYFRVLFSSLRFLFLNMGWLRLIDRVENFHFSKCLEHLLSLLVLL